MQQQIFRSIIAEGIPYGLLVIIQCWYVIGGIAVTVQYFALVIADGIIIGPRSRALPVGVLPIVHRWYAIRGITFTVQCLAVAIEDGIIITTSHGMGLELQERTRAKSVQPGPPKPLVKVATRTRLHSRMQLLDGVDANLCQLHLYDPEICGAPLRWSRLQALIQRGLGTGAIVGVVARGQCVLVARLCGLASFICKLKP
mmetsp:Transcript_40608/g.117251  ORF Transcript_40608/g.117251 Transcript_40608/m.117251 type:complete len:200 (-) Transcript_40608:503-1102(-)